jgi:hypothetical protein
MSEQDYKTLLLQFIGSITLADHLGDVGNDINHLLKRMSLDISWSDWPELALALHDMGISSLYGTPLAERHE